MRQKLSDVRVLYRGRECRVVLGPSYFVERGSGALLGSGLPSLSLVEVETGQGWGLTVEIPEAPLKPGQVLVGGRKDGLRALTEAGVVRHTGQFYRSVDYGATFAVCDLLARSNHDAVTTARQYPARVGQLLSEPPGQPEAKEGQDRGLEVER